ncbi:MAG TPA: cupin domain-containing protein [bacterium]|nr:cupin domain-containing protein [bacterium]HPJ71912.1 cupin domain-containing protein [bacterium]HPQ66288.1 cupin domain-containing protein [bacterium]
MKITAIVARGRDAGTRFEEVELEEHEIDEGPGSPVLSATERLPAGRATFMNIPRGWRWDWHSSPTRDFVYVVEGQVTVTVGTRGAEESRSFGPGELFCFDDPVGRGHRTTVDRASRLVHIQGLKDS